MVKANVAVAIPDLVGESFDLFGDRGHSAIVAKEAGGVTVMGGGEILEPFPGVGGFDWRISRIDVGGSGSLAVVGVRFPWGVFVLVHPCAAKGVQDRDRVWEGGRSWLLCCRSNAIVGCTRDKIHMVKGAWVLTM